METNYSDQCYPEYRNLVLTSQLNNTQYETIKNIVLKIVNKKGLKPATIYSLTDKKELLDLDRRTSFRLTTHSNEITKFLKLILIPHLNKCSPYKWSLIENHYDIVSYDINGQFKRHRDYNWFYAPNRIQMSVLISLNNSNSGTQIWYPHNYSPIDNINSIKDESNQLILDKTLNSWVDIVKGVYSVKNYTQIFQESSISGGILAFPSDWYHSGLKVIEGSKLLLIATCSLKYNISNCDIIQNNIVMHNNNDVYTFNTLDGKLLQCCKEVIKNTSFEALVRFKLLQKSTLLDLTQIINVDYNFSELSLIMKFISGKLLSEEEWNLELPNNVKFYQLLSRETFISEEVLYNLIIVNKRFTMNYINLSLISKLYTNTIQIGLWSAFNPWMLDIVSWGTEFIPFYIINVVQIDLNRNESQSSEIFFYNGNYIHTSTSFSNKKRPIIYNWYIDKYLSKPWNKKPIMENIDAIITTIQNIHAYDDIKHNITDIFEKTDKTATYSYTIPKLKNLFSKLPGIANNITTLLIKNNALNITTNVKDDLKHAQVCRYYNSDYWEYDDYESSNEFCNGSDDYGSIKDSDKIPNGYDKQLITIRFGLYRNIIPCT